MPLLVNWRRGRKPVHEPVHEVGALPTWGWLKHT